MIFAFHGYPTLIHRLTYKRANHGQFHVHGYIEEGTTTTPFDMVMMNRLDRFSLAMDVIDRVPSLGSVAGRAAPAAARTRRLAARAYTREHGEDDPAIANWTWPGARSGGGIPPRAPRRPGGSGEPRGPRRRAGCRGAIPAGTERDARLPARARAARGGRLDRSAAARPLAARIVVAVLLPALVIAVWALAVAPRAVRRPAPGPRLLVETALFALAVAGLAVLGQVLWAVLLTVLVAIRIGLGVRSAGSDQPSGSSARRARPAAPAARPAARRPPR